MSGFRRVEHDHGYGYIYDKDHKTEEDINAELWDENIGYVLALREIAKMLGPLRFTPGPGYAHQVAISVLQKHNKLEEERDNEEDTTDSSIDVDLDGL